MRTLRLSLVGTVTLTLFTLTASVTAQSEAVPEVTAVTGQRLTLCLDQSHVAHVVDGWQGLIARETYAWSDPRLPVDMRSTLNLTADRVITGATVLDGPDGTWTGTWEAFSSDDGSGQGMLRLTGSGDYEGLIAFLHAYTDDEDCVECLRYDGLIVQAEMPPMPAEPPAY